LTVKTEYVVNPQAALSQVLMKTVGNEQTYYVYGLGLIGQEVAGEYSTYHFDLRGSTVAITNANGKVTDRYQYSAYGEILSSSGNTDTPFLYNGRDGVMTDTNGLYYMRARYYNPEIRRFVSQDILLGVVIDGQSLNRYAYVQGNPIGFVDPLGLARDGGKLGAGNSYLSVADFRLLQISKSKEKDKKAPITVGSVSYAPTLPMLGLPSLGETASTGLRITTRLGTKVATGAGGVFLDLILFPTPTAVEPIVNSRTQSGDNDVKVKDLKRLPKSKVKELGGESWTSGTKAKTGKSKSDLYWNPKTGDVYSIPKGGGIPQWVDKI
jgi:RHS repeat-associated protein